MANSTRSAANVRDKGSVVEYDGKGIRLVNGAGFLNRTPQLFSHFDKTLVAGEWVATETGTGTNHAAFANSVTAGGWAKGIAGATGSQAQEIGSVVAFTPSTQALFKPIVFEARVSIPTSVATGNVFVGLMDHNTATSGLAYVMSTSSTFTTSYPTDAVGFVYSATPTSGNLFTTSGNYWGAVSTISNTDTATRLDVNKAAKVAVSTAYVLRVEVDANGTAVFFQNGAFMGRVYQAVTAATPLYAYANITAVGSASTYLDIDYIYYRADLAVPA